MLSSPNQVDVYLLKETAMPQRNWEKVEV